MGELERPKISREEMHESLGKATDQRYDARRVFGWLRQHFEWFDRHSNYLAGDDAKDLWEPFTKRIIDATYHLDDRYDLVAEAWRRENPGTPPGGTS